MMRCTSSRLECTRTLLERTRDWFERTRDELRCTRDWLRCTSSRFECVQILLEWAGDRFEWTRCWSRRTRDRYGRGGWGLLSFCGRPWNVGLEGKGSGVSRPGASRMWHSCRRVGHAAYSMTGGGRVKKTPRSRSRSRETGVSESNRQASQRMTVLPGEFSRIVQ